MRAFLRLLIQVACLAPVYAACANGENIGSDGSEYTFDAGLPAATGGASTAMAGTGGLSSSGGATGAGGASTGGALTGGSSSTGGASPQGSGGTPVSRDGGADGGPKGPCTDPTQKLCNGACVTPNPSVGCDPSSCTACPSGPTNGFAVCNGGQCGFDCNSGYVVNGSSCSPPPSSCSNNVKDGSETDVDCGGGCPKCADGKACSSASDCQSAACQGGFLGGKTCRAATCNDKVKNGNETDVDCGGGAPCSACSTGKACLANTDCSSGPCVNDVCTCTPLSVCPAGNCSSSVPNNCGGVLDCSTSCPSNQVCNAGACCTPITSCPSGACGAQVSNGCGGSLDCSTNCAPGQVCNAGSCCDPLTVATGCAGKCGVLSDGCGGTIDCGASNCAANETCGGGGVPNVCACGGPPSVNVDTTQWSANFATSPNWSCTAAGTTTIDSAAGTVVSTSCALGTLDVTADAPQLDASGPHVMVVRLRGMTLGGGHVLKIVGDKPVVFLVSGNVSVASGSSIDASAVGTTAGPGGATGGAAPAWCAGSTGADAVSGNGDGPGGGGGGFGTAGGGGGNGQNGTPGGAGAVSTDTDLQPLRGGCAGGLGGHSSNAAAGAGGGAFEISASGTISVAGTLSASGGAGKGQTGPCCTGKGGDGGGSGGGILLVSPSAPVLSGAVRAHGGAGSGGEEGGTSSAGQDGHTADDTAASGGNGQNLGGKGGSGGLTRSGGASAAGTAGASDTIGLGGGGGGGGGGGRVVVMTSAAICM